MNCLEYKPYKSIGALISISITLACTSAFFLWCVAQAGLSDLAIILLVLSSILVISIVFVVKESRTLILLDSNDIFAFDGVKNKYIRWNWNDIKSAYIRDTRKGLFLILSTNVITSKKDVISYATKALWDPKIIFGDDTVVIPFLSKSGNKAFLDFISNRLDNIDTRWQDPLS